MNNNKSNNDNRKRLHISITITGEEYNSLEQKAADANLSVSRFVIDCALQSEKRYDRETVDCAKRLISVSRMIDEIEEEAKSHLKERCGQIWQFLK